MEFDIVPYKRIGPLKFGMGRAEVRQVLSPHKFEEFRKTEEDGDYGFESLKLGIGTFNSDLENKKTTIESVIVFRKGYYD